MSPDSPADQPSHQPAHQAAYHQTPARPAIDVGAGLAIAAVVLAILHGLLWVGNALSAIPLAQEIADGASFDSASTLTLALYSASALLTIPSMIVVWVLTALWLVRAVDAAKTVNPHQEQRRGSAWLVLGWVVPIANFFVPAQVLGDLRRAAHGLSGALVGWWWTTWLVTLVLYRVHGRILDDLTPGSPSDSAITASLALALSTLVALVLWVLLVRSITVGLSERALRPAR